MNIVNNLNDWELLEFDFCDEEQFSPKPNDTQIEYNEEKESEKITEEVKEIEIENRMMHPVSTNQIESTSGLDEEIKSSESEMLKAPLKQTIFSKPITEKQLRWEQLNKKYALAYDANGNEIVVRKVNRATQLAYWFENNQVQVFENKEKTGFTCRDGSSFTRKKPLNIENDLNSLNLNK